MQVSQKDFTGIIGSQALPSPGAFGPELQDDGYNGAAPIVPALQAQPGMGGVDVGEQMLVLIERRFYKEKEAGELGQNRIEQFARFWKEAPRIFFMTYVPLKCAA